ncbi:MAG: hypothetical protein AAGF12_18095 [Myxococcota bacterium]
MILTPFASIISMFEGLNDRERLLVSILGTVLGAVILFLPLWLVWGAISEVEAENAELRTVLRDIGRAGPELAERRAQEEAANRRYDNKAPALGSFLEAKAREAGYDRPLTVTNQPEKNMDDFHRRHVRANLTRVGLRTAVDLITNVENSRYPVAVEQLQIDHHQSGDQYSVQLGVITFDRRDDERNRSAGNNTGMRSGNRAGPPPR